MQSVPPISSALPFVLMTKPVPSSDGLPFELNPNEQAQKQDGVAKDLPPASALPFTLTTQPIPPSSQLPFELGNQDGTADNPTNSTPNPPAKLGLALGVVGELSVAYPKARTVAGCQTHVNNMQGVATEFADKVAMGVQITNCQVLTLSPFLPLSLCMVSKSGQAVNLATCQYLPSAQSRALFDCLTATTTKTTEFTTCFDRQGVAVIPLSACQVGKNTPITPLSVCVSRLQSTHALSACAVAKVSKAVGVPCRFYPIPDKTPPPTPTVCQLPPPSSQLPFALHSEPMPTSDRLPFALGCYHDTPITQKTLSQKAYIMHHTVSANLAGLAIAPLSFNIKTDIASFCWQGQVEISKQDYDKVKHKLAVPLGQEPLITVNIDGLLFTIIAEEVSHTREFAKTSVSLSGRSVTARLSADYAGHTPISNTDLYASQIVSEQLANLPITANYQLGDWLIPQGVYTGNGKTPIAIIDDIARACGGFVSSHPHEPSLTLAPKYKVPAWQLATATPDKIIGLDPILRLSTTTHQAPRHNTVTLVGSGQGGIVYREYESRDKDAPTVDNPLLTDKVAFMGVGVQVLSDSGTHTKIGITLPLSKKHGIGLATLGEIWQINDVVGDVANGQLSPYKAIVTAISLDVQTHDGAVSVRQTVELDRYDDV